MTAVLCALLTHLLLFSAVASGEQVVQGFLREVPRLTATRGRALKVAFSSVEGQTAGLIAPTVTVSEGGLATAGNATWQRSTSGIFTTAYNNQSDFTSVSVPAFTWLATRSLANAACLTVNLTATDDVDIYVFTTQAYTVWRSALFSNATLDPAILQPPNVALEGVFRNTSAKLFTTEVDPEQTYLLTVFNGFNQTLGVNYSFSAHAAGSQACLATTATAGAASSNASSSPLPVSFGALTYLNPSYATSIVAVTGASCVAFGASSRAGPDSNGLIPNLNTDILSPATQASAYLNMTVFLLSESGALAYGLGGFRNAEAYAVGVVCRLSHNLPGPCFGYADNLDPAMTYSVWFEAGLDAARPDLQLWTWSTATGLPTGSCSSIYPKSAVTAPPSSSKGSGSSSVGAIVGGVVGGSVALAIIAVLLAMWAGWLPCLLRRQNKRLHNITSASSLDKSRWAYTSNSDETEDFGRALTGCKPSRMTSDTLSDGSFWAGSQKSGTISRAGSEVVSDAGFSEISKRFGVVAANLPSPSDHPSGEGIVSIADKSDAGSLESDAYLEDTWKIPLQDLRCKMVNGEPVLLGQGGFGSVYKGILNGVREVAVKVVTSASREQQARFIREIKTLKACLDPNIVQFLGACVHEQQTIMVMQFMSGGDLYSKIGSDSQGHYLWYDRGSSIALDVIKGICFLHSKKIAHLDLKSPNVLLTKNDEAKIADVGLGKLIQGPSTVATQMGSFMWASPEQLLGGATTVASDIYSFGTLLWEICTGDRPAGRHLRKIDVPREAPQGIADLVDACHEFNAEDRPTAVQVHNAMMQFMAITSA